MVPMLIFVMGSCADNRSLRIKPDFEINPQLYSQQIVNVSYVRGPNGLSLDQSNQLMKTGFLNTNTPEMGYYSISCGSLFSGDTPLYIIHCYTLGVLMFLGVPTDYAWCQHLFILDFFDSNGTRIKSYEDTFYIRVNIGLYYGSQSSIDQKIERELSKFWAKMLQRINNDSQLLNEAFITAGPVTVENKTLAQEKIKAQLPKGQAVFYAQGYVPLATQSASSSDTASNTAQHIQEAFQSPLDGGTYRLANTNIRISIAAIASSGVLVYTDANGKVGSCSYTINGNIMIINLPTGRATYTVLNKTSFSGPDGLWVKTGY